MRLFNNLIETPSKCIEDSVTIQDVERIKWVHRYSLVWVTETVMYTCMHSIEELIATYKQKKP